MSKKRSVYVFAGTLIIAAVCSIGAYAAQPRMENGLRALEIARAELLAATPNKGGHRRKAIQLIDQAIIETKMGIAVGAMNR
jgi:hypothetical protein